MTAQIRILMCMCAYCFHLSLSRSLVDSWWLCTLLELWVVAIFEAANWLFVKSFFCHHLKLKKMISNHFDSPKKSNPHWNECLVLSIDFSIAHLVLFFSVHFNKTLHLHDPGIFQYTTVQCVPAQKLVPFVVLRCCCHHHRGCCCCCCWHGHLHCKHSTSINWSQHKSHSNVGRVKWFHPFSMPPTSFNWCLKIECSILFSLMLWPTQSNDHSTPIIPDILIIMRWVHTHALSQCTCKWNFFFNKM